MQCLLGERLGFLVPVCFPTSESCTAVCILPRHAFAQLEHLRLTAGLDLTPRWGLLLFFARPPLPFLIQSLAFQKPGSVRIPPPKVE